MTKVTVVGAGNVGATCAHSLLRRRLADVALIDINDGLAKGKALDMAQAGAIEGFTHSIIGGADYQLTAGSDVVVITAGLPRRPGMTREELLDINAKIVREVVENALEHSPEATLVIVTNPLDLMVHLAHQASGLDSKRVVGMGGVLDSARFKHFIAEATGANRTEVEGMVIGSHSDAMVPLASLATANGRPISELLSPEQIAEVVEKTKKGGAEIVSYLKSGSAFYAPGVAAAEMVSALLGSEKTVLPACVYASGAFGIEGLYLGQPVALGSMEAGEIVELPISPAEFEALAASVREVEAGLEALSGCLS